MNRVREIREMKGIKQNELASAALVSQPYLCDLERGNRSAKPETMKRIADALGCTINDLFPHEVKIDA